MKRFVLRKIKQHSYSRQGWIIKDCGFVYAIYDREWQKNIDYGYVWASSPKAQEQYKYINHASSKEVAQYWANYLNAECSNIYGRKIFIPGKIFHEGLKLYNA